MQKMIEELVSTNTQIHFQDTGNENGVHFMVVKYFLQLSRKFWNCNRGSNDMKTSCHL
jgi:hypothetical protein